MLFVPRHLLFILIQELHDVILKQKVLLRNNKSLIYKPQTPFIVRPLSSTLFLYIGLDYTMNIIFFYHQESET